MKNLNVSCVSESQRERKKNTTRKKERREIKEEGGKRGSRPRKKKKKKLKLVKKREGGNTPVLFPGNMIADSQSPSSFLRKEKEETKGNLALTAFLPRMHFIGRMERTAPAGDGFLSLRKFALELAPMH